MQYLECFSPETENTADMILLVLRIYLWGCMGWGQEESSTLVSERRMCDFVRKRRQFADLPSTLKFGQKFSLLAHWWMTCLHLLEPSPLCRPEQTLPKARMPIFSIFPNVCICVCLNNICRMELLRFFGQWFLGGAWCFWPSTYSKSNTQINTTPKGCHGGQRKRKKPTNNKWNVLLCLFVQVYSLSNGKPWKRLWVWRREMITQSKNGQKGHSWSFWAIFFFFFFWEGPLFWLLFSICRDSIITIIKCFWRLLIFLMTTEFRNNFFSECGVVECERWHCLWYPWYQKGLTMLRVDFSIRTFLGHSELQVELRMKFLEIQQSGQQGPSLEIKINPTSSYLMTV